MKIILLCGPSCSGKSTIAKLLVEKLEGNILSLDKFYVVGGEKFYVNYQGEFIRTFERQESYDGDGVAHILRFLMKGKRVSYQELKEFSSKEKETIKIKSYQTQ